jgi:hypothetical protein
MRMAGRVASKGGNASGAVYLLPARGRQSRRWRHGENFDGEEPHCAFPYLAGQAILV